VALRLTRRISVQLLTLLTLDVAIKNSGDAFLREVASSSISNVAYITTSTDVSLVDSIGNMARSVRQPISSASSRQLTDAQTSNHDVRVTTLRLLQNWATAFESRPNLAISPLVLLYRRLRVEGTFVAVVRRSG
jgi:growth factor-regulated tyrosine kinase substrate